MGYEPAKLTSCASDSSRGLGVATCCVNMQTEGLHAAVWLCML